MSVFYRPRRTKNLYNPEDSKLFKLSRSKIDLYLNCPRCFYLDRRLGVGRPPGFPFTLNNAVDALLKREFDRYRAAGGNHPLIEQYGVDARPVPHTDLEAWRNNFTGIRYLDEEHNFLVFGALDDLWQNSSGDYIVVDYKATARSERITELNKEWHIGYKRQMEVYQWLLRKKGYPVNDRGYFLYCNGRVDRDGFDGRLEFDMTLIPYNGDDSWVDGTLGAIQHCLNSDMIPPGGEDCDYCGYIDAVKSVVE